MKTQNVWFKLGLSIIIFENILKSKFMKLFLRGGDEKLIVLPSDQQKKTQDFVLHCTFWGL